MFDVIIKFIEEKSPTTAIVVIALFLIVWATIKLHSFYIKTQKVCDSYPKTEEKLDLLIDKFNSLIAVLGENNAIKNPTIFSTNSPINLTAEGIKFIEILGWDKVFNDDKQKRILFEALDHFHLKTKPDVERYCMIVLTELYGSRKENPFTGVKNYLYNDAKIEKQDAISACAIYLRDKYLGEHPEII